MKRAMRNVLVALAVVVVVGVGLWFAFRPRPPPAEAPPAPVVAAPDAAPAMPSTEDADARIRAAIGGISNRPELALWAQQKDLARRFVALVDNVAEGRSPRAHLDFIAPKMDFKPSWPPRWDNFADVIASVDAAKFAAAYKELHPLFDAAYGEMAQPGASFDARLKQALTRLAAIPYSPTPPAVKRAGALYVYADPRLESLKPVEKQLIRMGPRNQKLIQDKSREVAAALGYELR